MEAQRAFKGDEGTGSNGLCQSERVGRAGLQARFQKVFSALKPDEISAPQRSVDQAVPSLGRSSQKPC